MELQLLSTRVRKLRLELSKIEEGKTSFVYNIGFSENNKRIFSIEFDISIDIDDEDNQYMLECTYEAIFETNADISNEFMQSNFPKVNAPAIAFPYFRAFISIVTQQAGYSTVVLPSFNFVKLSNERNHNKKQP